MQYLVDLTFVLKTGKLSCLSPHLYSR